MTKAAVVGVGYLGKFHAEKYAKSKKCELVAVVDADFSRAKSVASKCKTEALESVSQLVARGVECASVVTDTSKHYEIAKELLENGIDVLLEKPMTTTVEEANELIALAEKNSRILQVGHLERFNPAFRAMKDVLDRPHFFEARRIAPFSGRGFDVDVVLDLMIHDIDIIAHLAGSRLERVDAVGIPVLTDSFDIANARLTFESGAVANVTASRAAFKSERTLRVFQPDVYISLDYEKKRMKIYQKSGDSDEKGFPKIEMKKFKVEDRDALADEVESFLDSVQTRNAPIVSGEDGLRALEFVINVRASIEESIARLSEGEKFLKAV